MDEEQGKQYRDEIYGNAVRAGKRTYFFDVKATRGNDLYLTITESKKRFDKEEGKPFYEKHKLFLYKEDFEKFQDGLKDAIDKIKQLRTENEVYARKYEEDMAKRERAIEEDKKKKQEQEGSEKDANAPNTSSAEDRFTDVDFDDLGKDSGENKES